MADRRRVRLVRAWLVAVLVFALGATPLSAAPLSDPEPPNGEEAETPSYFCVNPDVEHPMGGRLAGAFDADYSDVMAWFCEDGMGFGQIMLALTTAKMTGEAPSDLLAERTAGKGWGEIWQEMGLIGRGRLRNGNGDGEAEDEGNGGPPAGRGRPEELGPPPGLDRGQGSGPPGLRFRPPFAGPGRNRGQP
jgi:hypothetical protein